MKNNIFKKLIIGLGICLIGSGIFAIPTNNPTPGTISVTTDNSGNLIQPSVLNGNINATTATVATNELPGIYLEHVGLRTYYGFGNALTNGLAFLAAKAAAVNGDSILLRGKNVWLIDPGINGALHFTNSINIFGDGSSGIAVNYYNPSPFCGATFTNVTLTYDALKATNFTWKAFNVMASDTVGGIKPDNSSSTNLTVGTLEDIDIISTGTNSGLGWESCFIAGKNMTVRGVRTYFQPVHGFIIKGVDGLICEDCGVYDQPSASGPFDALIIKSTRSGGWMDNVNWSIKRFTISNVHGGFDLFIQWMDSSIVTNGLIDGLTVTDNGTVNVYGPVWLENDSPVAGAAWNNITVQNVTGSGLSWSRPGVLYSPSGGTPNLGYTNTIFANFNLTIPTWNWGFTGTSPFWTPTTTVALTGSFFYNNILLRSLTKQMTNYIKGFDTNTIIQY